jgi:hypothetical protein
MVLETLRANQIFVNPKKCIFNPPEGVKFLGLHISKDGIEIPADRIKAIVGWAPPTSVKELQMFLGFANFYRKFIPGFAHTAAPLYELLSKKISKQFFRGVRQQEAFDIIKNAFGKSPILEPFVLDRRTAIHSDAPPVGLGAVLYQFNEVTKRWHPVAYFSRSLTAAERNYEHYEKEMLAIVAAFKNWEGILVDRKEQVDVFCDNTTVFATAQPDMFSMRHYRWHLYIKMFNYRIRRIPGKDNFRSDALSRNPAFYTDSNAQVKLLSNRSQSWSSILIALTNHSVLLVSTELMSSLGKNPYTVLVLGLRKRTRTFLTDYSWNSLLICRCGSS